MPITRRSTLEKRSSDELIKQVPNELLTMDHASSCSGSKIGVKTKASSSSRKVRAALQLAELRQKQVEIDNSLRLAAAKNEVEMAKLQLTLAEESEDEDQRSTIDAVNKVHEMDRYLKDCHEHSQKGVIEPVESTPERICLPKLKLPKVEIRHFDGNPLGYWMFVRQFELCIERRVEDPGQRLLYLMYYCKGRAKESIKGCVMLESREGYMRAREILRNKYGQPHRIARTLIDGIFDGSGKLNGDAEGLDTLATNMQNCEIALSQMNYLSDLNSMDTLERIVRMLPTTLQNQWAIRTDAITQVGREPSFSDLTMFVVEGARLAGSRFGQVARESEQRQHRPIREANPRMNSNKLPFSTSNNFSISKKGNCSSCGGYHDLEQCEKFKDLQMTIRWDLVKENGLCFKCLKGDHNAAGCRRREACGINGCRGRHHSLLHTVKPESRNERNNETSGSCSAISAHPDTVQLGTIPVLLKGPLGEVETHAFIDNGSDTTLITRGLLNQLGIEPVASDLVLTTVTHTITLPSSKCKLEVKSLDGDKIIAIDGAYAVEHLPIYPAIVRRDKLASQWEHLKNVPFTAIDTREVGILIGCDVPEVHWVLEQRIGNRNQPYATKTLLGWILQGPTAGSGNVNCTRAGDKIRDDLRKLYDQEFLDNGDHKKCLSIEEARAIKTVRDHTVLTEGHFVVPLPWRSACPSLPNNYITVKRRLQCLHRRLSRDNVLRLEYKKIIDQYLKKGYVTKVSEHESQTRAQPCWYVPHHPVVNPKKPGKIRIVFDCAAKHEGTSLNDQLYTGPDSTSNLCSILVKFRWNTVALAADIEEMFLRVRMNNRDQGALRFLWWPEGDLHNDPAEYKLKVHPFGATSSPFCANFALRQAVKSMEERRGLAPGDIVSNFFYVDDYLASFSNPEIALEFSNELSKELRKGGFKLRKWMSNSKQLLPVLPDPDRTNKALGISDCKGPCERTLGIEWDTNSDQLRFDFRPRDHELT